jgi:hypothetical protein
MREDGRAIRRQKAIREPQTSMLPTQFRIERSINFLWSAKNQAGSNLGAMYPPCPGDRMMASPDDRDTGDALPPAPSGL